MTVTTEAPSFDLPNYSRRPHNSLLTPISQIQKLQSVNVAQQNIDQTPSTLSQLPK